MTAYTSTHTHHELTYIIIDFLAEYGIQMLAFAGIIAIVSIYVWIKSAFS